MWVLDFYITSKQLSSKWLIIHFYATIAEKSSVLVHLLSIWYIWSTWGISGTTCNLFLYHLHVLICKNDLRGTSGVCSGPSFIFHWYVTFLTSYSINKHNIWFYCCVDDTQLHFLFNLRRLTSLPLTKVYLFSRLQLPTVDILPASFPEVF